MLRTLLILSIVALATAADLTVQTKNGPVKGFVESFTGQTGTVSAVSFKGVRYAAPPVGNLRWSSPTTPNPWTTPVDASSFGDGCPQTCDLPPHGCPTTTSEDCLFLNVYTPEGALAKAQAGDTNDALPVMFWIHGGHFMQGSGAGPLYNGVGVANTTGVVIVSINYRLGALGWLNSGDGQLEGNYGLEDQIFALQWVKDNIASFGGNPNSVTIYGQSAGGTSVATLMSSPATKGLFHGVIMQSNPIALPIQSQQDASILGPKFNKAVGCGDKTDIACMRSKTADEVVAAQNIADKVLNIKDILQIFYPWTPSIGKLVPDEPLNAFINHTVAPVPLILGAVQQEGNIFTDAAFGNKSISSLEYEAVVTATFGVHAVRILFDYPAVKNGDNHPPINELLTDYIFKCPNRLAARSHSQVVNSTYLYRFNHYYSFLGVWGPDYKMCTNPPAVCHAEELVFVFDLADMASKFGYILDNGELDLSAQMSGAWSAFAKNGSPNSVIADWPEYNSETDTGYLFQPPGSGPAAQLSKQKCDMFDQIGYHF